jgi:hypothetical protein
MRPLLRPRWLTCSAFSSGPVTYSWLWFPLRQVGEKAPHVPVTFFSPLPGCLGCFVMNQCCHSWCTVPPTLSSLQSFLGSCHLTDPTYTSLIDLSTLPVIREPVILHLHLSSSDILLGPPDP